MKSLILCSLIFSQLSSWTFAENLAFLKKVCTSLKNDTAFLKKIEDDYNGYTKSDSFLWNFEVPDTLFYQNKFFTFYKMSSNKELNHSQLNILVSNLSYYLQLRKLL